MMCIVATVALVLALHFPALAESFQGRVVAITDGDTIRVLRGTEQVRVRLHGIDTPEKRQALGTRARQYAGELAHEKLVRVEVKDTDRNGRIVGVVILPDGRNLNHELVRAGFAWWFEKYARNDDDLARLEQEARKAKRGLWADASPVAPWEFRHQRKLGQ
jgi:endonuclease YncB( thermonuclease family)